MGLPREGHEKGVPEVVLPHGLTAEPLPGLQEATVVPVGLPARPGGRSFDCSREVLVLGLLLPPAPLLLFAVFPVRGSLAPGAAGRRRGGGAPSQTLLRRPRLLGLGPAPTARGASPRAREPSTPKTPFSLRGKACGGLRPGISAPTKLRHRRLVDRGRLQRGWLSGAFWRGGLPDGRNFRAPGVPPGRMCHLRPYPRWRWLGLRLWWVPLSDPGRGLHLGAREASRGYWRRRRQRPLAARHVPHGPDLFQFVFDRHGAPNPGRRPYRLGRPCRCKVRGCSFGVRQWQVRRPWRRRRHCHVGRKEAAEL